MGKTTEVLIEEKVVIDDLEYQTGYTKEYIKVGVMAEKDLTGTIVKVTIIKNMDEILLAQL